MALASVTDINVTGRRVLLRAQLDVPLTPAGGIADDRQLLRALPTIRSLLDRGARLVLAGTLGDGAPSSPTGAEDAPSFEPVGLWFAEKLGRDVLMTDEPVGDGARKVVQDLREGHLALLENLARAPGEARNEEKFSQELAGYGDVYIADAFAATARRAASTVGVVKHISERAIGPLFERDLSHLSNLTGEIARPFVAVIGGARVTPKLAVIEKLLPRLNALFLGGAVGNTFLAAAGGNLGRSLLDVSKLASVRALIKKATQNAVSLYVPRDLVAAAGTESASGKVVPSTEVPDSLAAMDIGPDTARYYSDRLQGARTVFWAGSMGLARGSAFSTGTVEMARSLTKLPGALTVVAGAHTTQVLSTFDGLDRLSYLSGSDDAALGFLQGKELPGLVALEA